MKERFLCLSLLLSVGYLHSQTIQYPKTRTVDTSDTYFGIRIKDPYRWLEDDNSPETLDWVRQENSVTEEYISKIPIRARIKKELTDQFNYSSMSAPVKYGSWYYFFRNTGLQSQDVLFRMKNPADTATAEVFLDPNSFSNNGQVSLAEYYFSADGSLFAYMISNGGSDWREIIVRDAATLKQIGDTIRNVKFSDASWKGNEGFYYSTYDVPAGQNRLLASSDNQAVYYHRLGTPQSQDAFIFGGKDKHSQQVSASVSKDQHFLFIYTRKASANQLYIQDLIVPGSPIRPLVTDSVSLQFAVDIKNNQLYLYTNRQAPNYKLVRVDIHAPAPANWKDIIPEARNPLEISVAGGYFFASYKIDVKSAVVQFDYDGKKIREINFPSAGTVGGFYSRQDQQELFYGFTSFTYPGVLYHFNIETGVSAFYKKPGVQFNPDDYKTEQVFYNSKDGTKIPMYIVYKKGLHLNGKNPTYLFGYGGFNISKMPVFDDGIMYWLEHGGIYAQPNLRGGGEYGEKWHKAGTLMQKQNVFDDFIAAAEFLIAKNYTSSEYLAIGGRSNGGLLVGATITQRPDLMRVAIAGVGVMDMLRYNKFTIGAAWAGDYGTAEDSPEMFKYLLGYSPLHNIKPGTHYPATLVWTADHDDRVVPGHSFKFAATLQKANAGANPVLISIQQNAGHIAGMDTEKVITQDSEKFSFIWYNMGVNPFQ